MGHVPKDIIVKISRMEYILYIYIYIEPANLFSRARGLLMKYFAILHSDSCNIYIYIYSTLDILTMIFLGTAGAVLCKLITLVVIATGQVQHFLVFTVTFLV